MLSFIPCLDSEICSSGLPQHLQCKTWLAKGGNSHSSFVLPTTASFHNARWTLTRFPSLPARLAAYLQQQDEASLKAFSTASRVSPVRF